MIVVQTKIPSGATSSKQLRQHAQVASTQVPCIDRSIAVQRQSLPQLLLGDTWIRLEHLGRQCVQEDLWHQGLIDLLKQAVLRAQLVEWRLAWLSCVPRSRARTIWSRQQAGSDDFEQLSASLHFNSELLQIPQWAAWRSSVYPTGHGTFDEIAWIRLRFFNLFKVWQF